MKAALGQKAPLLAVSEWVQGGPVNFDQLLGQVVLVEVFQVNCPGCFLYALPEAIEWHERYSEQGLTVLGLATAFEDFDKNNLENLRLLAATGAVIGATFDALNERCALHDGKLSYRIPFPLAMDKVTRREKAAINEQDIEKFVEARITDFSRQPSAYQQKVRQAVREYLQALEYHPETFERFDLKGTPSHILIDKQGILRQYAFGNAPELETQLQELLAE
ncbi:MAG: thiol-disulfide isomerase [Gammaproteobacteria bacterium HGW-Gammaproteobacteria-3]|nr:MAG: thiol-disulfide isomerase [Gammaproteobacteria bacterium HGW-Gammaproteobacteria-3]